VPGEHDCETSEGQLALVPEHVASLIALFPLHEASRHIVVDALNASVGHVALEPVHDSATSQSPAALRQTVALVASASTGHVALEPVHDSATSQSPTAARHTEVDGNSAQTPSTLAPAAMLHTWQSFRLFPPHADVQHTPSTHAPDAHC